MVEMAVLQATRPRSPKLKELQMLLARVEELHEFNPMLGHRGCRLGITYPEITKMQARAIFEAMVAVEKEGIKIEWMDREKGVDKSPQMHITDHKDAGRFLSQRSRLAA